MDTLYELKNLLQYLKFQQASLLTELSTTPEGRLSVFTTDDRIRCNIETYVDGKRTRKGIKKDGELVKALSRKELLSTRLHALDNNVHCLEGIISKMTDDSIDAAFNKLPSKLKTLPQDYFFPQNNKTINPSYDDTQIQELATSVPISFLSVWGSLPYRVNNYHDEQKTVIMADGLRVRSKSEASLIELYRKNNIAIHYDEILSYPGGKISPDIIALRDDGKLIYHEHCGLVNDQAYIEHHNRKMEIYASCNIVPWDNLIITYDLPNGGLDIALAEAEIKSKLRY